MHLVTWNTQWCCGLDGEVRPERVVQTVQAMGECDVLCLQEIAVNYPLLRGHPGNQVAQLQALLPGWSVLYGAAVHEWTDDGEQQFGNVIATRLPVVQVQHYPLPYPQDKHIRTMPRMCSVVTLLDPVLGLVQVMTSHLEYYSERQRMAQARYLRRLQFERISHVFAPPQRAEDGSPFQTKFHTPHAVLCGDFNFEPQAMEYAALGSPAGVIECLEAGWPEGVVHACWHDAWRLLHKEAPHPHTFRVFDRKFGEQPGSCDFVWVSESLRSHVRSVEVDAQTQASDHQPLRVVIGSPA